jgi:hypothetical protein
VDDGEVNTRLLGNSSSDNVNQWLRILPGKEKSGGASENPEPVAFSATSTPVGAVPEWDKSPMRSAGVAAARIDSVSPVRQRPLSQRPVSPSSSAQSSCADGDDDDLLANEFTDCEEFLDWYYSMEIDTRRALGPSDKAWRRLSERSKAARQKSLKPRIEIARGKEAAALDNFNEEDKKVRARVQKMGANHIRRVQQSIADRRSRRRDVRCAVCHLIGRASRICSKSVLILRLPQGRNAWRDLVSGTDLRDPASQAFSSLPWQSILANKRLSQTVNP